MSSCIQHIYIGKADLFSSPYRYSLYYTRFILHLNPTIRQKWVSTSADITSRRETDRLPSRRTLISFSWSRWVTVLSGRGHGHGHLFEDQGIGIREMGNRVGEVFLGARQASIEHVACYTAAGHARISTIQSGRGMRMAGIKRLDMDTSNRELVTDF